MIRKLCLSLVVVFIMMVTLVNPVLAVERKVFGFNLPYSLCYESEAANNHSWIISGLIYTDPSFVNYDISLSCYGGKRFYHGDAPGRFYEGVYGSFSIKGVEQLPNTTDITLGTMGVFGYEWRAGSNNNVRLFIEGGFSVTYSRQNNFLYGSTFEAGLGFNIE